MEPKEAIDILKREPRPPSQELFFEAVDTAIAAIERLRDMRAWAEKWKARYGNNCLLFHTVMAPCVPDDVKESVAVYARTFKRFLAALDGEMEMPEEESNGTAE